MKTIKTLGGCVALLAAAMTAQATLYTYDFTGINASIPDGNPSGYANTHVIDLGTLPLDGTTTEIVDVNVRLNISGGYNGDLYGYLVHSSGFAVLLNRPGAIGGNPFGYSDPGMNITLDDQAGTDIHGYSPNNQGGPLSGIWAVDGRNVDPNSVTDADSRTALLNSFNGTSANGTWTLFLADMSGGGQNQLVSWGLDIEVVPEPTTWGLMGFAGVLAGIGLMRWMRRTAGTAF